MHHSPSLKHTMGFQITWLGWYSFLFYCEYPSFLLLPINNPTHSLRCTSSCVPFHAINCTKTTFHIKLWAPWEVMSDSFICTLQVKHNDLPVVGVHIDYLLTKFAYIEGFLLLISIYHTLNKYHTSKSQLAGKSLLAGKFLFFMKELTVGFLQ